LPITKAARFAEPGDAGSKALYALPSDLSVSQRRSNGNWNFSANFRFSSTESKLAPRMTTSFAVKSRIRSRNPQPSLVQPGVSARG